MISASPSCLTENVLVLSSLLSSLSDSRTFLSWMPWSSLLTQACSLFLSKCQVSGEPSLLCKHSLCRVTSAQRPFTLQPPGELSEQQQEEKERGDRLVSEGAVMPLGLSSDGSAIKNKWKVHRESRTCGVNGLPRKHGGWKCLNTSEIKQRRRRVRRRSGLTGLSDLRRSHTRAVVSAWFLSSVFREK